MLFAEIWEQAQLSSCEAGVKKIKSWEVNSQASGHNPSISRFFSLREFSCCQHILGKKSDFLLQWKKARKAVQRLKSGGGWEGSVVLWVSSVWKNSRFQESCVTKRGWQWDFQIYRRWQIGDRVCHLSSSSLATSPPMPFIPFLLPGVRGLHFQFATSPKPHNPFSLPEQPAAHTHFVPSIIHPGSRDCCHRNGGTGAELGRWKW